MHATNFLNVYSLFHTYIYAYFSIIVGIYIAKQWHYNVYNIPPMMVLMREACPGQSTNVIWTLSYPLPAQNAKIQHSHEYGYKIRAYLPGGLVWG